MTQYLLFLLLKPRTNTSIECNLFRLSLFALRQPYLSEHDVLTGAHDV
jgi:hypothetical protein